MEDLAAPLHLLPPKVGLGILVGLTVRLVACLALNSATLPQVKSFRFCLRSKVVRPTQGVDQSIRAKVPIPTAGLRRGTGTKMILVS
jgi:hypothetical protein